MKKKIGNHDLAKCFFLYHFHFEFLRNTNVMLKSKSSLRIMPVLNWDPQSWQLLKKWNNFWFRFCIMSIWQKRSLLLCYTAGVTLLAVSLSCISCWLRENIREKKKNLFIKKLNREEKSLKPMSCIAGCLWWLKELSENKEVFHNESKTQKL